MSSRQHLARPSRRPPVGLAHLPFGVFSTAGTTPRVGVRIGDWVLDASEVARIGRTPTAWATGRTSRRRGRTRASTPSSSWGRGVGRRARVAHRDPLRRRPRGGRPATPGAARRGHPAPADRGRRLRRLLRQRAPRHQRRPDLPARLRAAHPELEAPAHRVPRSLRHRRRVRDRRRAAAGPAQGPDRPVADLRAEPQARHRGRAGLRRGRQHHPGRAGRRRPAAEEHLFGVVLLNDWSARDIQAWEYVPLGPFLGKSFGTSIRAWVTPMAALAAARVPLPGQDPEPLPYLRGGADAVFGLDLHLEVEWNGTVVARPEYRDMYWSPAQMLAHLPSTAPRSAAATCSARAPSPARRRTLAAASSSSRGTAPNRSGWRTAASARSSRTATPWCCAPARGHRRFPHRARRGQRAGRPRPLTTRQAGRLAGCAAACRRPRWSWRACRAAPASCRPRRATEVQQGGQREEVAEQRDVAEQADPPAPTSAWRGDSHRERSRAFPQAHADPHRGLAGGRAGSGSGRTRHRRTGWLRQPRRRPAGSRSSRCRGEVLRAEVSPQSTASGDLVPRGLDPLEASHPPRTSRITNWMMPSMM